MAGKEILRQIDKLQNEINAFGKLDSEVLKRIHYKFRLDWNYHSNAMEGNSLTREETRSVMVNNITVEGKPLKDVIEIRGHDTVISDILKIGRGELRLSEARIKDIHSAILHEENEKDKAKIGEWKTVNNFVTNYRGEKFEFTPHADVKESMHELINWLNNQSDKIIKGDKYALHPVILALDFHLRYVTIHPFYDGNGRTARIFTNLILIAFGYPPIIIKVESKETYNRYLADIQAYGGDANLFYEFMGQQLVYSQELVLKAIEGISIEEPDDLDKGIDLLKKNLTVLPGEVEKSKDVLISLWKDSLLYLSEGFLSLYGKFEPLFENPSCDLVIYEGDHGSNCASTKIAEEFFMNSKKGTEISSLRLYSDLKQMKRHNHNAALKIRITFSTIFYEVTNFKGVEIKKAYSDKFNHEEIDNIIKQTGASLLEELNSVNETNNP